MKDRRVASASRALSALFALLAACGAKSPLDLDPVGGGQGASAAVGGSAASGNGGTAATAASGGAVGVGGVGNGGASGTPPTGGSSTGGSSGGGACSGLDFDFTTEPDEAVAYMIDPGHTGAQLATRIEPPLGEIWRHEFETGVSYPVMAGSKVFVTVNSGRFDNSPVFGAIVHAIDAASGAILWTSELIEDDGGLFAVHLAYDRGSLFAANDAGTIMSFDPENGAVRWRTTIDDVYAFGGMPVASGGAVFYTGATGGSDSLFILDECNGDIVYRGHGRSGNPTLGAGMLFSSSGCNETEAIDPRDGSVLWHYQEDCFGGGGEHTVFHDGLLYVGDFTPETTVVLDANTGDRLTTIDEPVPFWPLSVAGDDVVLQSLYLGNYALKVFDPTSGSMRWSISLPAFPRLPALVTPGYAFALAGAQTDDKLLYAIDLTAREVVWQSPEPTVPYDLWVSTGAEPIQAMAAGGGRIVVAYNGTLVAYAPMEAPECGNAEVEDGETCDDGNTENGDYCSAACDEVTGRCGDRIVQDNETCDGPPTRAGTSCSDTCQLTFDGVMLAAGNYHTCGLRQDGSVTCWGAAQIQDELPPGSYRYISACESYVAGLLTNGSPVLWGSFNTFPPDNGTYQKLEAGLESYCGIRANDLLECFGEVATPTPARRYVELSMLDQDFCAVTTADELWCFHQGVGVAWGGTYRTVAVGIGGTCAIRTDRTLFCSENAEPPAGEFTAVTAGFYFWCGIRTSGDVVCWGNLNGRDGSLVAPPGKFSLIDAGWQHACGVRTDGTTVCWGANEGGQSTPPTDFP